MSEFNEEKSLFCIFHNQNRYLTKDNKPCSHIFSGVVEVRDGELMLNVLDFDGRSRTIDTDLGSKQFNLAAMIPVPRKTGDAVQRMVEKLNLLDPIGKWPFYFSPDMTLVPKYEVTGVAARAPEGNIDPPMQHQELNRYQSTGARFLVRVNCVRMALMTARMAGVNINNIANVNPLSNTGEEVRDRIHAAYRHLTSARRGEEAVLCDGKFIAKKKGCDKNDARFVVASDGLCIIQAEKDFRMPNFCDALAKPVNGKSLFNWISEGKTEKFKQTPLSVPRYLDKVLALV